MIDHYVSIGGEDVSADCYGIQIAQTMTTDSDPGKAVINLVNRKQKYTNHWAPQKIPFAVYFSNYSYKYGPTIWYGLAGHITDVKCTAMDAVVTGECGMGHLADALGKEYAFKYRDHDPKKAAIVSGTLATTGGAQLPVNQSISAAIQAQSVKKILTSSENEALTTAKNILIYILSEHEPDPIGVNWDEALDDLKLDEQTYSAETTYQYVVNDIAQKVGATFYFRDPYILEMRKPKNWDGMYNLDGYMINPEQTSSIMGYCNIVEVIGSSNFLEGVGPGAESPSVERAARHTAEDAESIERYGELRAPAYYSYDITTKKQAQQKAEELLEFFKLHENAMTKPIVAGMCPPLQSKVGYTPFVPIDSSTASPKKVYRHKTNTQLSARTEAEYNKMRPDERAEFEEVAIGGSGSYWGQVTGVVIEREIEYDADQGLICTLTIAPELAGGGIFLETELDVTYQSRYADLEED
jgi:hypothetical protein